MVMSREKSKGYFLSVEKGYAYICIYEGMGTYLCKKYLERIHTKTQNIVV